MVEISYARIYIIYISVRNAKENEFSLLKQTIVALDNLYEAFKNFQIQKRYFPLKIGLSLHLLLLKVTTA